MPVMIIILMLAFIGNAESDELWKKYDLPYQINCLTGHNDYIWAGTEDGVVKMNRNDGTLVKYTTDDGLVKNSINHITSNSNGYIFAGSKNTSSTIWIYNGGLSIYNGNSWKSNNEGTDGLSGKDIAGLKVDNNGVTWVAVNNTYIEKIEGYSYCIFQQSIQFYDNSIWKTLFSNSQKIKADGNWTGHVLGFRKNIKGFDIADSSYYAYVKEDEYYQSLKFRNGVSSVYIDYIHSSTWINDVAIEQRVDNSKIIYVNALFSDGIYRIVYGKSDSVLDSKIWNILSPPDSTKKHVTDVKIVIDKSNTKWFVDLDTSKKKYLIKYDDANYLPYTCPSWTDSTEITCLYADDLGYIWVGTQSDGLYRFDATNATAVETAKQSPATFTLATAYPNPFNASTTINFTLNQPGKVNLSVYSLTGQKVRELAAGNYSAGNHTAMWDGRDDSGNAVSSGVYLARMESGGVSKVVRMAMVK